MAFRRVLAVFVCSVAVASDSDDNELTTHAAKPTADVTAASNFPIKLHGARINVKYNFLDLSKSPNQFVLPCEILVILQHFTRGSLSLGSP